MARYARQRDAMRWEERLLDLFDDLEQQAEGLALIGRDAEVAELSRAEYAQVDLADRLHASEERSVRFGVNGFGLIEARLARVGEGWCLLADGPTEWVVRTAAVRCGRALAPLGARSLPARPNGNGAPADGPPGTDVGVARRCGDPVSGGRAPSGRHIAARSARSGRRGLRGTRNRRRCRCDPHGG